MNPAYDMLMEMSLGALLLKGFTAAKQEFNAKSMVYSVVLSLNDKGIERLNELTGVEKLEGSDDVFDENVGIIDLEKMYFQRPEYVNRYQEELDQLISNWSIDRSERNTNAWIEYINNNGKNSPQSWRQKVIGSKNDLIIFAREQSALEREKYRIVAVATESIPLSWISAFLRDVGKGNSIYWYGYNNYASDYGMADMVDDTMLLVKTTPDVLNIVMWQLADDASPMVTADLTVSKIYSMGSMVESLIATLETRKHLHRTEPATDQVDILIGHVERIGLTRGKDYWELVSLLDRILNQLNYRSQLDHLIKAGEALDQRIGQVVREIYQTEMDVGLKSLADDPRFKDFELADEEYSMWRFYVMNGASGAKALLRIQETREEKEAVSEALNAATEAGFTEDGLRAMAEEALEKHHVLGESKTAKARKIIDGIVTREEADLRKYIDEAEALALSKDVSMDYAGALLLLEKLFGEYAKETLEELVERDKEDSEWQMSYLEVASISLKPVNYHKVTREELGAFYLWLNTTRHELNKDK